jgi:D-alanyl-D-alanine carboxypeptidase
MVVIMQWVAKKHIPEAIAVLSLLVVLLTGFTTGSISTEPEVPSVTSCFDSTTATIRVTIESQCPVPLITLGDSALTESVTATGGVLELHPLLAARFEAARISAASLGVALYITSGFRSQERQSELFAEALQKYGSESEAAKWVLPAQFSHHPDGLAIDVNYPKDPDGAKWLEENGARFGLCRVYANEWWHFEGVIAPGQICPAMAENALVDMR